MQDYGDEGDRPWYAYRTEITSVTVEAGVTSIGANAFWHFTTVTSMSIANSVEKLGSFAFAECYNLLDINNNYAQSEVHKAVFENVTNLGSTIFSGCGLTRVDFLSALEEMEDAFFNWHGDIVIWDEDSLNATMLEEGYTFYFADYGTDVGCQTYNLYVPVGVVDDFEASPKWYNPGIVDAYEGGFNDSDGWEELGSHVLHVYEVSSLPDYVAPGDSGNGGGSGGPENTGVIADVVLPSVLVVTIATVVTMYLLTFKKKKRI